MSVVLSFKVNLLQIKINIYLKMNVQRDVLDWACYFVRLWWPQAASNQSWIFLSFQADCLSSNTSTFWLMFLAHIYAKNILKRSVFRAYFGSSQFWTRIEIARCLCRMSFYFIFKPVLKMNYNSGLRCSNQNSHSFWLYVS